MDRQSRSIGILIVISVMIGIGLPMIVYRSFFRFQDTPEVIYDLGDSGRQKGGLEKELDREIKKVEKELEAERERKKSSEDTIADYKRQFGKNYAAVLKKDLDEFKKERNLDEFRKKFDYDLFAYETYQGESVFEDDGWGDLQGDPTALYENALGADIFNTEAGNAEKRQ